MTTFSNNIHLNNNSDNNVVESSVVELKTEGEEEITVPNQSKIATYNVYAIVLGFLSYVLITVDIALLKYAYCDIVYDVRDSFVFSYWIAALGVVVIAFNIPSYAILVRTKFEGNYQVSMRDYSKMFLRAMYNCIFLLEFVLQCVRQWVRLCLRQCIRQCVLISVSAYLFNNQV